MGIPSWVPTWVVFFLAILFGWFVMPRIATYTGMSK